MCRYLTGCDGGAKLKNENLVPSYIVQSEEIEYDLFHSLLLTFQKKSAIINIQKSGVGKVSLHRSFFPDAMLVV